MARDERRWYLNPALRPKVKTLVEAEEGGYRGVGQRIGLSFASVNRIVNGVTKSSSKVPALLRLLGLDVAEHLALGEELSDEQIVWLKLLADIERAGKDPLAIEASVRQLANLPPTEPE